MIHGSGVVLFMDWSSLMGWELKDTPGLCEVHGHLEDVQLTCKMLLTDSAARLDTGAIRP